MKWIKEFFEVINFFVGRNYDIWIVSFLGCIWRRWLCGFFGIDFDVFFVFFVGWIVYCVGYFVSYGWIGYCYWIGGCFVGLLVMGVGLGVG